MKWLLLACLVWALLGIPVGIIVGHWLRRWTR